MSSIHIVDAMDGAKSPKRRGRPAAGDSPASIEDILSAALRVFARDGFAGASVASINRELGVSHNLIHQRFGSKEALWYAMVDWIFGNITKTLAEPTGLSELSPLERFRAGVIRFLELHAANPDILRLVSVEAAIESPRLAYLYDHHITPGLELLTLPLKTLIDQKILNRNDIRSLHFLIAHGAAAPFTLVPLATRISSSNPRSKAAIRRHASFVADLIVSGLEAKAAENLSRV